MLGLCGDAQFKDPGLRDRRAFEFEGSAIVQESLCYEKPPPRRPWSLGGRGEDALLLGGVSTVSLEDHAA